MNMHTRQKGAAVLIVVLFFVILSTTLLIGVSTPIMQQISNSTDFLASKKSYNVADMQAENTLYRFNKGKTDAPSVLSVLGSQATAVLTDISGEKQISIQGVLGEFQRFVKARFKQDSGVAFNYGLQSGIGGIQMSGSSYIVGNVYSNGDIVGNGGPGWYTTYITGSATAATISNSVAHVSNDVSTTPPDSFDVGLTNTNQDFAQSFVVSTSTAITEIDVMLKKVGSPANATVKIVNNASGLPGSTVITSGTLSATLATTLYSSVPITMTTSATLVPGTTYWLVIDVASNNMTNYYTLGMNDGIFTGGDTKQGRLGTSWAALSPSTLDVGFKVLVGGDPGSITNMGVGTSGSGSAWSDTVTNTTVSGSLFCQIGSGNNKACDTSKADPVPSPMPISQGNIDEWKALATAGGSTSTLTVNGVTSLTLGPKKINGNLTVTESARLNLTGPIYVTGNVTVSGSGKIYVDSSMGTASGIIVTDGRVDLNGSGGIYGSGTAGSYVVISSTSQCPSGAGCSGSPAISVSGAAGSVVLSAPDGTVNFSGSAGVKAVVAKTMVMSGATNVTYDSGLADLEFTSGPSGSWTVSSWKESLGL
ncbi:MAG: choice-of-anchor R domain-containing protein [Patescibacteria group bacterium]